jgi:adenosylmethionine-8-amino-7-oxononanoate aminotransferase
MSTSEAVGGRARAEHDSRLPHENPPEDDEMDTTRAARSEWLSWTKMSDFAESGPPVLVRGEGPYLTDADGNRLLDAMSGLFTTQIGYSHGEELAEAAAAQLRDGLGYYPNWAATTPVVIDLVERILDLAPPQMTRVFFTSGGSEAVESAWKLARQHHLARGEHARRKVISRPAPTTAARSARSRSRGSRWRAHRSSR